MATSLPRSPLWPSTTSRSCSGSVTTMYAPPVPVSPYLLLLTTLCCRSQGRLSSYIGRELTPYTAFCINETGEGDVRQVLIHEKGIIALGTKCVGMYIRRGIIQWEVRYA